MADVCASVTGAALDTANACESHKKQVNGEDADACKYTAAGAGKCMKDGQEVSGKDKNSCTGDVGSWEQNPATCVKV